MKHDEKINYMRIASGMACFGFTNEQLDKLVSLYELVIEKQGEVSIKDVVRIESDVEKRCKIKKKRELLDKVSKVK